jgi:hypothetical protein
VASNDVVTGRSRLASALVALGGWVAMIGAVTTWAILSRAAGAGLGAGLGGTGAGGGQGAPRRQRREAGQGVFPSASPSTGPLQRPRRGGGLGRTPGQRSSLTVHGLDTTTGKVVLGLAIAIIVVGALGWVARAYGFRLGALAVALVAGLVALVLTITELFTIDSEILGAVRARVAKAAINTSFQPGMYLAIAGSAIAVLAAVVGLALTRREWVTGPGGVAAGGPYPSVPHRPGPSPSPAPTQVLPTSPEPPSSAPTEQLRRVQAPPPDYGHLDPPPAEPAG